MANKANIIEHDRDKKPSSVPRVDRNEVRKVLKRLRKLGEQLPQVDAVAIVREGRDLTARGPR